MKRENVTDGIPCVQKVGRKQKIWNGIAAVFQKSLLPKTKTIPPEWCKRYPQWKRKT